VSGLALVPRQRRSQELSLRILNAAERVLRKDGADGVVMGAVAKEAGVSVGGIYGRFRNREELVSAIHSHMHKRILEEVRVKLSQPFASLGDLAQGFAETLVESFERDGALLPMLTRGVNLAQVTSTHEQIIALLTTAIRPFEGDFAPSASRERVGFLVQFVLACVAREACGPTYVGWDVLRRDLPRLARLYVGAPSRSTVAE
jgi:AcrR family transcriptional regulator